MTENPTKTVNENGSVTYTDSAGRLHRENGPAVEWADGYKNWLLHGEFHREEGPAIEYADGYKAWLLHGLRHREDGPAIERVDGTKEWYLHGLHHREDGPAIIGHTKGGTKHWYLHGVEVDREKYEHVRICPLEELPEYIGTPYECLAKKRLGK